MKFLLLALQIVRTNNEIRRIPLALLLHNTVSLTFDQNLFYVFIFQKL